jgi:UDP:flavonoid glycosyltransferase YjiC (YdhE family)
VALRTLAGEVEAMRRRGFNAAPIAAEVEALASDDWRARTLGGALMRAVNTCCARAPHEAADLLGAIEGNRPDALIVDALAWGALSVAEAWSGPWACSSPFPLPLPSRDGPPMGPGFPPARGPLGKLRDRVFRSLSSAGFQRLVDTRMGRVRAGLGLRPLAGPAEMFLAAPLLLCMTAEPFEYPRPDWPERIVMVGPCSWEPAGVLPAELVGIEKPLILVSTSSDFQDDGRLVSTALEALEAEPVHVVATLPAARAGRLRIPANATILDFAPHSPILGRCACAITHGGMGVTQKALGFGVPVCVVPFGRDQPEVARRVEVAAAGSRLPARRLRPDRLRAKVREAAACRPGAERIARAFAEAGGPRAAADAFERLVSA